MGIFVAETSLKKTDSDPRLQSLDGPDAPAILAKKIEAIKTLASSLGVDIFVNARTDVYLQDLAADEKKVQETLDRAGLYQLAAEQSSQLCRQAQCRFKWPGQYWSQRGDESLLCLETFWRNGRWHLLFPHNRQFNLSKN